nr:amidohydrolase family protein [Novosphingobium sp. SG751A]
MPPSKNDQRIGIFGSYVLTHGAEGQKVVRDQWVVIEGDTIATISSYPPHGADILEDRPGRFILPGFLNLRNHGFTEAIARTWTEDGASRKGEESILYTVLLPLSKRSIDLLSREERLSIARLGILQLLKGGPTTVMESFRAGFGEMFDAAYEMGIRFYGAPYLFSTADAQVGEDDMVRYGADAGSGSDNVAALLSWESLRAAWDGEDDRRIRLGMSPHAPDTCDPDLLRGPSLRAQELDIPMTMHLAQSREVIKIISERYAGRSPAEYLDWLGVLNSRLIAAHCVASSDADLALMAARGTTVANCPRVFARAGEAAPFGRFVARGVQTVVATDGYNMDALGELQAAGMISKILCGSAEVASAPELIDAVTVVATNAIDRSDLGRLAPGSKADLTAVDLSHPHLQPIGDPRRALVWLANRANIDMFVVDGRILVSRGHYCLSDENEIIATGSKAVERIWDLPEARRAFTR